MSNLKRLRERLTDKDCLIIHQIKERLILCKEIGKKKGKVKLNKTQRAKRLSLYKKELGKLGAEIYELLHEASLKEQQ